MSDQAERDDTGSPILERFDAPPDDLTDPSTHSRCQGDEPTGPPAAASRDEPLPEQIGRYRVRKLQSLGVLARRLPELADDLAVLERLMGLDVPSSLNKVRYLSEKVLQTLCMARGVSWGQAEPTLERMIGPLAARGVLPKSQVVHVRTVPTNTSAGSRF